MTRIHNHLAVLLATAFCLFPLLSAAETVWETDYAVAKQKASKENKDLLIQFTGSDWCGWCMKLEKEILSEKSFTNGIHKEFILVKIDFPRNKEEPVQPTKLNTSLKEKYRVLTFPTIILSDSLGRPYARTGYKQGGADTYITHIEKLQEKKKERDNSIALATGLEGTEKARLLEKALTSVPHSALSFYEPEIKEIHTADPDDTSGFYARYQIQKTAIELGYTIRPLIAKRQFAKVPAKVDDYVRQNKLSDEPLQTALLFKLSAYYLSKEHDDALKVAEKIIAINDVSRPGRYSSMLKKRILRKRDK